MAVGEFVSPIALDLGAKTTGVYTALYPSGISLSQFNEHAKKMAFVAKVEEGDKGYKLLQKDRTAGRHARRCRTRSRQAKKLFLLILNKYCGFDAYAHEVAISAFLNRRGYSYLDSEIDGDVVDAIPEATQQAWLQEIDNLSNEPVFEILNPGDLYDGIREVLSADPNHLSILKGALGRVQKSSTAEAKSLKPLSELLDFYAKDFKSGAKPRRKYFQDIYADILGLHKSKDAGAKRLSRALKNHRFSQDGTFEKVFHQLLCHINNFDLKLLNRILKSVQSSSDLAVLERNMSNHVSHWIGKLWSLSPSNGVQRLDEIRVLRRNLKTYIAENPNKIFSFLLDTAPELTIPPYESHTNRRPPSCQTLLLNSKQLDRDYPNWRHWLADLQEARAKDGQLGEFRKKIASLLSRKDNSLASEDEVDARSLQLILDSAQDVDPFLLNKIWSQLKKRKELTRSKNESSVSSQLIDDFLHESSLPGFLKEQIQQEQKQGTFWHLVNKYFQTRRRAREGRYFIHYNNQESQTSRWEKEGNLLVMCSHRPQQLKHQAGLDFSVTLGVSADVVYHATKDTALSALCSSVRGLKTACQQAHVMQKKYGADLKTVSNTETEVRKLVEKLPPLAQQLAEQLGLDAERQAQFSECNSSIFIFAQLYPMVWGDRSGFGSTCPVCALDNSFRMTGTNGQAIASRLNTLTMRLIDGSLKRLLNHQAHHIVNRIWPTLEAKAQQASKISVPLILEQNRFDFTDNLARIKGVKPKKDDKPYRYNEQSKRERILEATGGVCPYTGVAINTSENVDYDHIIPRSGPYGVLNDEANLIASSVLGNRKVKMSRQLMLSDLSPVYLVKQFGTSDVSDIERQIVQTIQSETGEAFKFGRYRQFVALSPEAQKAFRHALFLSSAHPLRRQVIDAISHSSKTKVNGTQRYMAQLIADILLQKAASKGLANKFTFDYFEVSSSGVDEDSTVALRRYLAPLTENLDYDFADFVKVDGKAQQDYSHVIDATMAFMLAAQQHQGEGALRIEFAPNDSVWGNIDEDGVISPSVLDSVIVKPSLLSPMVQVKPQTVQQKAQVLESEPSKKLHQVLNRTIFKQNAIGLEFYDLALVEGKPFKGYVQIDPSTEQLVFLIANSKPIDKSAVFLERAINLGLYEPCSVVPATTLFKANKSKLQPWLFNILNQVKLGVDSVDKAALELAKWIFGKNAGQLFYYSSKVPLEAAPTIIKKAEDSPYLQHWQRHYLSWMAKYPATKVDNGRWVINPEQQQAWEEHCQDFLQRKSSAKRHVQTAEFTMRSSTSASGSPALVQRTNWDGSSIYQLLMIDTNNFPKSQIAVVAKKSPRLALFNSDVLKVGYKVEIEEKQDIAGTSIPPSEFFKVTDISNSDLALDSLEVIVKSGTAVSVSGLPKHWVADNLVQTGQPEGRRWDKIKSLTLATEPQVDDAIDRARLNSLLVKNARSDKPVGVVIAGEQVTLTIPYKSTDFLVQADKAELS